MSATSGEQRERASSESSGRKKKGRRHVTLKEKEKKLGFCVFG
jgi:hypothetical protein